MILEVSQESSMLVRGAAAFALILHVAGGTVGIASGAIAMMLRKGGGPHRIAGTVFFVSMLITATIATVVAPFLPTPDWVNSVAGAFTLYLIVTAWVTARNREFVRPNAMGAFIFALLVVLYGTTVGVLGIVLPGSIGPKGGGGLIFAVIAAFAAVGDLKMILRNGISDRQRVSRHLWRMCLALFIATVSLFVGQPQLFSESIRAAGLLRLPWLAVLLAMIYWMVRARLAMQWNKN